MEAIFTIIGQDLEVAKIAVKAEDFNLINIIGNRIMSNVFIINKNEIMILGWLLKDLGTELRFLKQTKNDELEEIKKYSIAYLDELKSEIARENIDPKTYFEKYLEIESKIRKNLLSKHESVYDEQVEFSKYFAIKVLDLLYSNKKMLLFKNNNLSSCAVSEVGRIFNEHGGIEALIIYLVLKAFNDYYLYLYGERFFIEDVGIVTQAETKMNEYIEDIYKLKSIIISGDIDNLYNESNVIIGRLGADYRLYFLIYINSPGMYEQKEIREEKLELSPETKQKIGEIITSSLQEKLK